MPSIDHSAIVMLIRKPQHCESHLRVTSVLWLTGTRYDLRTAVGWRSSRPAVRLWADWPVARADGSGGAVLSVERAILGYLLTKHATIRDAQHHPEVETLPIRGTEERDTVRWTKRFRQVKPLGDENGRAQIPDDILLRRKSTKSVRCHVLLIEPLDISRGRRACERAMSRN